MITEIILSLKIAHFGAFDHNSFGDLLFPLIIEHYLPEFNVVHVSPSGKTTPWRDARPTISTREAFRTDDWDAIIIGGGDIIQHQENFLSCESPLMSLGAMSSLWTGATLLSAKLNIPCVWNAPGVPNELLKNDFSIASDILKFVDYLAVRDSYSAARIKELSGNNISLSVVPDTAILISQIWSHANSQDKKKPLSICITPNDSLNRGEEIELLINYISKFNNFSGEVILLDLMPWQGSINNELLDRIKKKYKLTTYNENKITLKQCTSIISNSLVHVGNSLHGFITAVSYGIPTILVWPYGWDIVMKYRGFSSHLDNHDDLLAKNFIEAIEKLKKQPPVVNKKIIAKADQHMRDLAANLSITVDKKKSWHEVSSKNEIESIDLLFHGFTSNQLLNYQNKKISDLLEKIREVNDSPCKAVAENDACIQNHSNRPKKSIKKISKNYKKIDSSGLKRYLLYFHNKVFRKFRINK